jgi:hypothetical protein
MYSSVCSMAIFMYPSRHTKTPRYSVPELSLTRIGRPSTDLRKSDGERWLPVVPVVPVVAAAACAGSSNACNDRQTWCGERVKNKTDRSDWTAEQHSGGFRRAYLYRLGFVRCSYRFGLCGRHDVDNIDMVGFSIGRMDRGSSSSRA